MKQTKEEFESNVMAFKEKMSNYYKENEKGKAFVCDGIIDVGSYFDETYKILWILKEAYSGSGDKGYLHDLKLYRSEGEKKDSPNTWNPIAYISYSVINNFNDLAGENIKNNKEINRVFKKIAIINVQKTEAGTRSKSSEIQRAYKCHLEIIKEQIETYNPSIIINCSGIKDFAADLDFTNSIGFGHFSKKNKIIINTYHPQQVRIKQAVYINKVIQRIKEWYYHSI